MNKPCLFILLLVFCSQYLVAQQGDYPPLPNKKNTKKGIVENAIIEVAAFPGGDSAFKKYLAENLLVITDSAVKRGIRPAVYELAVIFTVDTIGNLQIVKIESNRKQDFLESATKEMIERFGTWIPGTHNGKKIRAMRRQPITIIIE